MQTVSGMALDYYLERMTRSGNSGDTAFLHALACACKVEACFQVKGGPVIFFPSCGPVQPQSSDWFFSTLTLALSSFCVGSYGGRKRRFESPKGHVLTNFMKMWQYWGVEKCAPGTEPRVSGTAHGAAQCDTTTPQPLVFFSISMWVNLSLARPRTS